MPARPDYQTKLVGGIVAVITLGAIGFVGTSVIGLTTGVAEARVEIKGLKELNELRFAILDKEIRELKDQLKELAASLKKPG